MVAPVSGCPPGAPGTARIVGSVLPLQDLVAEEKGMTSILSCQLVFGCGVVL